MVGTLAILGTLLVAFAPNVLAQEDSAAVRGTLLDGDGNPIQGALISVEATDGEAVGRTETNETGTWEIVLPEPNRYRVTLHEGTLPDGISLSNPDRATLELEVREDEQRTVLFAVGDYQAPLVEALRRPVSLLVSGLRLGLIIAVTAIGLSLIFGTTGLVNFAHGEMVTFGAIAIWYLNILAGWPLILSAIAGVVIGAVSGAALHAGIWQPVRRHASGRFQLLIVAVGLSLLARHVFLIVFGGRSRTYSDFALQETLSFGLVTITPRDLWIIGLSIMVLVSVGLFLQKTRLGKALRAVADNPVLSAVSGIDVDRVVLTVWIMAGALAAVGGFFLGLGEGVGWEMGFELILLMFAGVILGGLGTAYGTMAGGIVIGIVTEMSTLWFPTDIKFLWGMGILIVVLLVRPEGIFGVKERAG